jgi:hypothetical protein
VVEEEVGVEVVVEVEVEVLQNRSLHNFHNYQNEKGLQVEDHHHYMNTNNYMTLILS